MSGLHLVKQGRDRRRIDLQRDFTVASPAEFVTRFGGNKVIEKVMTVAQVALRSKMNLGHLFITMKAMQQRIPKRNKYALSLLQSCRQNMQVQQTA